MKKFLVLVTVLPTLLAVGCPGTTVGLDLSMRGVVSLSIRRALGAGDAYILANVTDNSAGTLVNPMLELAVGQTFRVNDVTLVHQGLDLPTVVSGYARAMEPPDAYSIEFDDNGQVSQMQAEAVSEIHIASPTAGTVVPKAGFTLTWTPSGDADVLVEISVCGEEVDLESSTGRRPSCVYLEGLPDDGAATVDAVRLADLLPGTIDVTLRRYREVPQSLGFAGGIITVETWDDAGLLLTE